MPPDADVPTFPAEVVEAIARHMNDDHAEDNVRICRALGGRPDAESAVMTGVDGDGVDFLVDGPDGEAQVRIAWPERVAGYQTRVWTGLARSPVLTFPVTGSTSPRKVREWSYCWTTRKPTGIGPGGKGSSKRDAA